MASIKLYYFNSRGRGEVLRLLLAASGKEWEDVRFTGEEWPEKYKPNAPFGQAPYIEHNGKYYGQSLAIANFLAREFGLAGKTNLESLRVAEVVQLVQDFISCLVKIFYEKDDAKKVELFTNLKEKDLPKFFGFFQKLLKENGANGHFVGNQLTLADVWVYDIIKALEETLKVETPAKDYAELQTLTAKVEAQPNIKKYLDKQAAKA
ncbi:glutathione S-transferase 1-like [Littorina saxatilis]|uniref:Uncharacterized protein n=1 Tax=Littorina saxatilis TaxID=31220 RepID=A0AAN9G2X9_9CAEN